MVNHVVKKTVIALTLATLAAACSNSGKAPKDNVAADTTPVTLRLYLWDAAINNSFQELIADPVKKKYPHITLESVVRGKNTQPKDLVINNNDVDIIMAWNDVIPQFTDLKLIDDITPEVKLRNVDLSRYDPIALDSFRDPNKKEVLYGLPFAQSWGALFYNKDIFDKFGVAYPKDGMSWADTIELARKLTRVYDGVQFKGYDPFGLGALAAAVPLQPIDPKTQKASVENDDTKKVFEILRQILSIPGNEYKFGTAAQTAERFVKDKNVAMTSTVAGFSSLDESGINWDIAQYPSYEHKPNQTGMVKAYALSISTMSKNRDQAMKVIEVMTSEEVQLAFVKSKAMLTGLKNPEINKHFGEGIAALKGKNVTSIFKSKPAPYVEQTIHTNAAFNVLGTKFNDVLGGKDINTALREATEEINKQVQSIIK